MSNLELISSVKPSKRKDLEYWFQTSLGRSLLASQRSVIASIVQNYFGVRQLELGVSHRVPVGNASNIAHKYVVLSEWESDLPSNVVVSSSNELAIESNSVDLIILHHALDVSDNPHQTLREASRALKSSGHLVIIGFNPTSIWGMRKLFNRNKRAPWNSRFISGHRISDWLNLLHFEVSDVDYHYYGLPYNHLRLLSQFKWLGGILNTKVPLGAFYVMSAQKQTYSRIQPKPRWSTSTNPVGFGLSSSRNIYPFSPKTDRFEPKD